VVRAGTSVDNIDVDYCSRRGIFVANCPLEIANAISELTIGLILAIDRRIAEGVNMLKHGNWNAEMFRRCKGLKGRTLGIIGFESAGQ